MKSSPWLTITSSFRFDIMEKAISMSTRIGDTLQYCLRVSIYLG